MDPTCRDSYLTVTVNTEFGSQVILTRHQKLVSQPTPPPPPPPTDIGNLGFRQIWTQHPKLGSPPNPPPPPPPPVVRGGSNLRRLIFVDNPIGIVSMVQIGFIGTADTTYKIFFTIDSTRKSSCVNIRGIPPAV